MQLKVDLKESLHELSLDALDSEVFPLPVHLQNEQYQKKALEALERLGESFIVLPNQEAPKMRQKEAPTRTLLNDKVVALTNMFEVASDKCQYDHPLCMECVEAVGKELDGRLQEAKQDLEVYKKHLDVLKAKDQETVALDSASETDDDEAEKALETRLALIRNERETLKLENKHLQRETKQLELFEQRFWEDYQDFELELDTANKEYGALKQKIKITSQRLERMKRTNVLADTFHISYDGHFGTINGFRLGRLPVQPVDWMETNAALGQVVLLLKILGDKLNYDFKKFKPISMGSFSKILRVEDNTTLELSGSNEFMIGRLFWYRTFDAAMEGLLCCIKELGDSAKAGDPKFDLSYIIDKDKIHNISIKLQFNQGDLKWTKALKYMLTNLKLLLAWCSKRVA